MALYKVEEVIVEAGEAEGRRGHAGRVCHAAASVEWTRRSVDRCEQRWVQPAFYDNVRTWEACARHGRDAWVIYITNAV